MTEITLDLETAGSRPGCAILSIGAVAHVPGRPNDEMEEYYATIDLESSQAAGMRIEAGTLNWWLQQDLATRAEAFSGELSLQYVLFKFADWMKSVESEAGIEIYSKGPSFDCAHLAAAYAVIGQKTPWHYSNERCVRTVVTEAAKILGVEYTSRLIVAPEVPHHALHDARAEMATLLRLRQVVEMHIQRSALHA